MVNIWKKMIFVFDEAKSRDNKEKHGIDFIEAQALWLDADRLCLTARSGDEARFIIVGRIDETNWSAVITYRGDVVRLISVRRSHPREVRAYESE